MRVFDPTANRMVDYHALSLLPAFEVEEGRITPARSPYGEWFALREATGETWPLKQFKAAVDAVSRRKLSAELTETCAAVSLTDLGFHTEGETLDEAEESAVTRFGAEAVQEAAEYARMTGFHGSVIRAAWRKLLTPVPPIADMEINLDPP